MKLLTANYNSVEIIGLVMNEQPLELLNLTEAARLFDKPFPLTLLQGIQEGESFIETVHQLMDDSRKSQFVLRGSDVQLLAPIPRPAKNVFCIGKNYRDHALELGTEADIPKAPMVFSKAPTTVIGTGEVIELPESVTQEPDYEGELAVVIGKTGKGIRKEEAYNYVFGYTILNDVTARDLQSRHKQFLLGKSLDTSCPMGPYLVHKSAVETPDRLHIRTTVNGEVRQDANTSQLIFDIPTLIEVLSKGMTLEAGDIIATGTPAGVGKGFKPPRFLQEADVVTVEIDNLGKLSNPVRTKV